MIRSTNWSLNPLAEKALSDKLASRVNQEGNIMKPVSRMTAEELQEIVEEAVERKLFEIVADPDRGLKLKPEIRRRLKSTLKAQRKGERGIPASQVAKKLGLRW
jgi:hypothetical protein